MPEPAKPSPAETIKRKQQELLEEAQRQQMGKLRAQEALRQAEASASFAAGRYEGMREAGEILAAEANTKEGKN
ncbi:MAG: hypothetical protein KIT44_07945 [Opitutaceae bacterium]|nr:hypothetical protein [Opitutaceae bacterium]